MTRYHLKENGEPGVCHASERDCPYGGEHFNSSQEARKSYEESHRSQLPYPKIRQIVGNPLEVNSILLREADLPPEVSMRVTVGPFLIVKADWHPDARWKAMGGRWHPKEKVWWFPANMTANALIEAYRLFGTGAQYRQRRATLMKRIEANRARGY